MFQAVNIDISGTVADLDRIHRQQLPFAVASALTKTVQDAQYSIRKRMFSVFTIRNSFTQAGIVITPATKTNWYAEVIARPWYLGGVGGQEEGGERVPHNGHNYLAVPLRDNLGVSKSALIPTHLRPKNLMKSGLGFIITLKDGRKFIFMRTGQGHFDIKPVYVLIHEALVKPVLEMEKTVLETVQKMFEMRFNEAMAGAVATAF